MVGFSSETAERGGWLCRISDTLSTRGDAKTEEPGLCQTKIPMEKQRWFRKTWMMFCLNEWWFMFGNSISWSWDLASKGLRIYHVDLFFPLQWIRQCRCCTWLWKLEDQGRWDQVMFGSHGRDEKISKIQRVYVPTRDAAGFDIARSSKNQTVGCLVSFF